MSGCHHGWDAQRGEGCPEGPGCNEFTVAWATCPTCGESWTSDIDPSDEWPIREVVDECRAHLIATEHSQTFDVGIEP